MKNSWVLFFLFLSGYAFSVESEIESKYIENYVKQMKPILIEKFSQNMPGRQKSEIVQEANLLIGKMAKCQFDSVSHYPEGYWEKAIIPVSKGTDIYVSNQDFEDMLTRDLESGVITEDQLLNMVHKAQEKAQLCLQG